MTSLVALLCLNAAMLGSTVELKLSGDVQMRGGYTHTPFVTGPDGVPLLNAPVSATGMPEADLILTPGIEFDWLVRHFKLTLQYQPRVFLDFTAITQPPTVFHMARLDLSYSRPNSYTLSAGADMSLGGLDYGQAGQVAQEFSGALRPGTSSSALQFFNASAYARAEINIGRAWKFSTTEAVGKKDTPPLDSSQFIGPTTNPNSQTIAGLGSTPSLQSEQQAESRNELDYKINDQHHFLIDLTLNVTSFPGANAYLSFIPEVGWKAEFSKLTRLDVKVGVMRYWTNPFPGRFNEAANLVVGEVSIEHTFADIGLPRLKGRASISEAPYYDIIFGVLEPRGTVGVEAMYDFDRQWQGSVQLRDYTEAYWDGQWRTIPKGHDKNVAIVSLSLKYKYSRWLTYQGGVYGLDRALVPSATAPYTQLQDFYVMLGVTGNYDLVE